MKFTHVFLLLLALTPPLMAEESTLLGLAVQRDAAYLGASENKLLPVPLIDWQKDNFFTRSGRGMEEAGINWQLGNGFALGSQLALELGRSTDDSTQLQQLQMPDIAYGVSVGVHAEYLTQIGPAPLKGILRLRQRSGASRGALVDLRFDLGIYDAYTIGLKTYLELTWANKTAMESDFGLKSSNAAYGGLLPYEPDADLRDVVLGIAGKIDISQDWMAIAAIEHKQLKGDAAASPLVEQKNTNVLTLGTICRF